jgi:hypothetical protein
MRKEKSAQKQNPKNHGRVLARVLAEDMKQAAGGGGLHTFTPGIEPGTWDYDN